MFLDCTCVIVIFGRYKVSFSDFLFSQPLALGSYLGSDIFPPTASVRLLDSGSHLGLISDLQSSHPLSYPGVPSILKANGTSSSSFIGSKSTLFIFESIEETVLTLSCVTCRAGHLGTASWSSCLGLGTSSKDRTQASTTNHFTLSPPLSPGSCLMDKNNFMKKQESDHPNNRRQSFIRGKVKTSWKISRVLR